MLPLIHFRRQGIGIAHADDQNEQHAANPDDRYGNGVGIERDRRPDKGNQYGEDDTHNAQRQQSFTGIGVDRIPYIRVIEVARTRNRTNCWA